jgi:hypothetical protein
MTKNIKDWNEEVVSYLDPLNEKLKNDQTAKDLYFGFEIWDSNLVTNPTIMFIGINPGSGDEVAHYKVKANPTERISYLDCFDERYPYRLAEDTIQYLKLSGLSEDEIKELFNQKCVKTNFFYIKTKLESDIKRTLDAIGSYKEYFKKSAEFTNELIKIIKPKFVICEGKTVFDNLVYVCERCEDSNWTNDVNYYYDKSENIKFIGYKRRFSNVIDNASIAELLKGKL